MKVEALNPEKLLCDKLKLVPVVKKIGISKTDTGKIEGIICAEQEISFQLVVLDRVVPQVVKQVIHQSKERSKPCYLIIMAPYVSPESAAICRENKVGYIDYSGNCLIAFENVYISDTGHANLFPKKDRVQNLFRSSSVVTSKILRVLLQDIRRTWKLQYLATEVGCSIGLVSRVKEYLIENNWADMDKEGLIITDSAGILRAWSNAYQIAGDRIINAYQMDSTADFEKKIRDILVESKIKGCLTGFSGGVRYAPVVRYSRIHMWIDKAYAGEFIEKAGLKLVDSGANVLVFLTESDEVFCDSRIINGCIVASPVQEYLDCMKIKGRGEELADAILKKEILK